MASTKQNDNQVFRYEDIIKKLYNTLDAFGPLFPELPVIREQLLLLPARQRGADSNQEIREIEEILKNKAVRYYIVRHLYHNFKREVEALQLGGQLDGEKEFYIDIPA